MVAALQEVAGELRAVIKRVRGTEHEVEDLQRVVTLARFSLYEIALYVYRSMHAV